MQAALTVGAEAALLLACPTTGVVQPGGTQYRSADLNVLRKARLIVDHHRRADGLWLYRLLPSGWDARRRLRKAGGR